MHGYNGGGLVAKLCPTLVTPWTVACQTPLSMGFPRQEYWNGLPFPFLGDLLDPGIEPRSTALQVDSLPSALPKKPSFYRYLVLISGTCKCLLIWQKVTL